MSDTKMKKLTEGNPTSLILGFAIPLLSGMLFQQFYNLVDTIIVGKTLGKEALGAVGSTGSINFMILGFCMGICMGFVIPVAQRFGAESYSSMRKYVMNAAYLSIAFSVVITVVVCALTRKILVGMNTPGNIIDMAYSYIFIIFLGIPILFLYNLSAGIMRSLGDSKTPVYFLVLASVLNIFLDLLFIKGFHMGVSGPAIATNISQLISGVLCLVYLKKKFPILKMEPEEMKISKHHCQVLMGMGIPMGLQYSITAIGSVVLQTAVNGLGSDAVASVTAASKLMQIIMCPYEALGSTMGTYCGQNIGARRTDRVRAGVKSATIMGLIYAITAFIISYFFAGKLILLFLDAAETVVISQARTYVVINTAFYFLLSCVNIYRFSIQGMGYSIVAIIAGILEMVARALVGILLVGPFGIVGAAFASPLAWVFADIFLIPCFFRSVKKMEKQFAVH